MFVNPAWSLYEGQRVRLSDDTCQLLRWNLALTEVGVTVAPAVEAVPRVVEMHQIDPPGHRQNPFDQALQRLAAGPGVTRIEAETRIEIADRVPQTTESVQAPRLGVVPSGGILDEYRDVGLKDLQRLSPTREAFLDRLVVGHMTSVHDDSGRPDLLCANNRMFQDLAAGNPNTVVGTHNVHQIWRVDVDGNR